MSANDSSLLRKAIARHQAGDLRQAMSAYQQVLAADPRNPDALHMLGVALAQAGRAAEAAALIRSAVEIRPENGWIHFNLGNSLSALQRHSEALVCYQRAAALLPQNLDMQGAACNTALTLGRFSDALAASERVLALRPDDVGALLAKAAALIGLERAGEALPCCDRALELMPDDSRVLVRRGIALVKLERLEEAEACLTRAVTLNPSEGLAHCYLGNLHVIRRRHELALASFSRGLELLPDNSDARWNIGLLRLLRGELQQGWDLYEERFARDAYSGNARRFKEPRWTGRESLQGRRILLWAERGLGDTLHFCRYAPLVRDLGAEVILEVQPRLKALLHGQFPGITVVARDTPLEPFDYECPLLSVPRAFGTELGNIPVLVPYLRAEPDAVARWSSRLPSDTTLRVGIAWQGNPDAEKNWARGRSLPLAALEPLAHQPGVSLISLQTGPPMRQLESVAFSDRILSFGEDLDAGAGAFLDSAAIVMSLDLVISSDTAVAHLAGALGVPVWVALHVTSEWRWLLNRSDSPWYPTMRLFRQKVPGDWSAVVEGICASLAEFAARRPTAHGSGDESR
jgi:tetratricopeptide (TPR) repeat protein